MSPPPALPYGVLILRERRVVFASPKAAALLHLTADELAAFGLNDLLGYFSPLDASRLERLVRWVEKGEFADPQSAFTLHTKNGEEIAVDLLISATLFQKQPAVEIVLVDITPRRELEGQLAQNIWRLQALHDISQAMLSQQDEVSVSQVALRNVSYLVDHYYASAVYQMDRANNEVGLLTYHQDAPELFELQTHLPIQDLAVEVEVLQSGLPVVFQDLDELDELTRVQSRLKGLGIRACICVPIRWDDELHGLLTVHSLAAGDFPAERVQVAVEIANLLAVALRQAQMQKAARARREEAEAMRDVVASLAGAGDINHVLERVLVNLHNVIVYDTASLYLADENERFVVAQDMVTHQRKAGRAFDGQNPLLDEMRALRQPLIVDDIRDDPRFTDWPEVQTVRSWLGAPLVPNYSAWEDREMIGFLSLGSLEAGHFQRADADRLRFFAEQVAQMLERAWQSEQAQRRSEELEVLSSVTLVLGKSDTSEDTLHTVLSEIAGFAGAQSGVFLFPDRLETRLIVKASLDKTMLGLDFPSRWNPLWDVYVHGETQLVDLMGGTDSDTTRQDETPFEDSLGLFKGAKVAVLAPVKSAGSTFGVLGFGFSERSQAGKETLNLTEAVAEIAAASLHRAVTLENLEHQMEVRTQHLSTLYEINTAASEPLELQALLQHVLEITLGTPERKNEAGLPLAGMIHTYHEKERCFRLEVGSGLPAAVEEAFQTLPADGGFWVRMLETSSPVVINDISKESNLPEAFLMLRIATMDPNRVDISGDQIGLHRAADAGGKPEETLVGAGYPGAPTDKALPEQQPPSDYQSAAANITASKQLVKSVPKPVARPAKKTDTLTQPNKSDTQKNAVEDERTADQEPKRPEHLVEQAVSESRADEQLPAWLGNPETAGEQQTESGAAGGPLQAYIGAPVRAKGRVVGLLSLFDRSILDYTIEDLTLFMTIADQVGGLIERARLMSQAEAAAVMQERQRLARELHDSVTQLLYSQMLFSGAGLKVLRQGDQPAAEAHLERISQAALQALKEMRLLVYQLRPSEYLEEGLAGALQRRLDLVEKRTGINARLIEEGDLSLDEAVEMALYRIAEEALNNTLKHSQAKTVTIRLSAGGKRVVLEVIDDGIGFDLHGESPLLPYGAGMGLENMRERARALGGVCEVESQPGAGTRVRVELEVDE